MTRRQFFKRKVEIPQSGISTRTYYLSNVVTLSRPEIVHMYDTNTLVNPKGAQPFVDDELIGIRERFIPTTQVMPVFGVTDVAYTFEAPLKINDRLVYPGFFDPLLAHHPNDLPLMAIRLFFLTKYIERQGENIILHGRFIHQNY